MSKIYFAYRPNPNSLHTESGFEPCESTLEYQLSWDEVVAYANGIEADATIIEIDTATLQTRDVTDSVGQAAADEWTEGPDGIHKDTLLSLHYSEPMTWNESAWEAERDEKVLERAG